MVFCVVFPALSFTTKVTGFPSVTVNVLVVPKLLPPSVEKGASARPLSASEAATVTEIAVLLMLPVSPVTEEITGAVVSMQFTATDALMLCPCPLVAVTV